MQHHQIKVSKTAHYYTLGTMGNHIEKVLFAFHGYGQAAERFINKFKVVDDGKTLVICPEGLHRFYWEKFTGNVVASWMTSKDREQDINDNHLFLSQLFEQIMNQIPPEAEVTCLGFSQGCATMSRWLAAQQPLIHQMILWAGELAHDADFSSHYFKTMPIHLVYGTEDPFLSFGFKEKNLERSKIANLDLKTTTFKGGHTVNKETLKKIYVS